MDVIYQNKRKHVTYVSSYSEKVSKSKRNKQNVPKTNNNKVQLGK